MKTRNSFVTNSSSSSYVISYKVLPVDLNEVLECIKENHGKKGVTKIFEDVRFEDDHIVFRSGNEVDSEYLFYEVNDRLYSKSGETENW